MVLLPILAKEPNETQLDEYANSKQWLRLIHYYNHWYVPGLKSRVDRKEFFLSEKGKRNPRMELLATIKAFKSPTIPKGFNWHPQCAFPARRKVLERDLGLTFPSQKCEDFNWWRGRIKAKGISLVFSSYYASNPASMFGHTLLKFNTEATGPGKLSDVSLNFAANTFGAGGIEYMYKGIFGGYPGFFTTDPYYVRVNEYAQGESRDLWEYELELNQSEIDLILAHVWELKTNTYFDYYFFDENCSFMLLEILEVAKLDWQLSHGFFFYTMPIDTVRRVQKMGAIRNTHFRPSFQRKMEERIHRLSIEQIKVLKDLITEKGDLSLVKDREVIEAYSSYLQFKRFDASGDKEIVTKLKKKITKSLIARAKLGGKTDFKDEEIIKKFSKYDPLKGHMSYSLHSKTGYSERDKVFSEFKFRFALADLLNNDFGYPNYFELQGPFVNLRYNEAQKRLQLQELNLVSLLSLEPFSWYSPNRSWGINVKSYQPFDYDSNNSLLNSAKGFYGITLQGSEDRFRIFLLGTLAIEHGKSLPKDNFRLLSGLRLGSIWRLGENLKLLTDSSAQYSVINLFKENLLYTHRIGLAAYLSQDFEVHIEHELFSQVNNRSYLSQNSLSFNYFF